MKAARLLSLVTLAAALSACGGGENRTELSPEPTAPVHELRYGTHPQQRLVVALPDQAKKGVVVWVHGGGWQAGDPRENYDEFLSPLTKAGYTVVSIGYRLGPGTFPQAEQDVAQALRALLEGGCETCEPSDVWGALRNRLQDGYFAAGGSAGGPTLVWAVNDLARNGPVELPACAATVVAPVDLRALEGLSPEVVQIVREHTGDHPEQEALKELSLAHWLSVTPRLRDVNWHVLGVGADALVYSATLQTHVSQLQQQDFDIRWHFEVGTPDFGHGLTATNLQSFLVNAHEQCFTRGRP
jgi:hypothetical protein